MYFGTILLFDRLIYINLQISKYSLYYFLFLKFKEGNMKKNKIQLIICFLLLSILISTGLIFSKNSLNESTDESAIKDYNKLFKLNLFSDKKIYKSTDKIQIWATLEYIGKNESIEIWHGNPYISFKITDGKNFNISDITLTTLSSTILEKNKIYKFDYSKSGGYSKDDINADFWKKFYQEKDLYLPKGEYKITVGGAFSINKDLEKSKSNLVQELNIIVE